MGKDLKGKVLPKGISQRSNGSYIARYTDRDGKRKSFYGRDLKQVKKKLEKIQFELSQGIYSTGEYITLEQWFEEFIKLYKEGRMKDTTVARIRQTFSIVRKTSLVNKKLNQIRAVHIQELINELDDKEYSRGTLELLKSLLNEMFKRALGNGYILVNPCDSVILPRKAKKEPRFLTQLEQDMFLDSAKGYVHEDIFLVNLSTGCRIGEILGLKWTDISYEKKQIHIQRTLHYARLNENEKCHFFFTTPKTITSDRVIPLLPETEIILRRVKNKQIQNKMLAGKKWKQEEGFEDMVFTTQHGAPIRDGDVNRTIKKVVLKANLLEEELAKEEEREPIYLETFSAHCFRHTFITKARQAGLEYDTIRMYVGHSNKEMTEYYDHNETPMDVEGLKAISFINVE